MMVTKGNVSTCPRTPRRVPQALHQQRNCFYRAGPARPGPTAPTFEPFTTTNTTPPPTEQPQENGKGRRRCRAAPLECFMRVRAPTKRRSQDSDDALAAGRPAQNLFHWSRSWVVIMFQSQVASLAGS